MAAGPMLRSIPLDPMPVGGAVDPVAAARRAAVSPAAVAGVSQERLTAAQAWEQRPVEAWAERLARRRGRNGGRGRYRRRRWRRGRDGWQRWRRRDSGRRGRDGWQRWRGRDRGRRGRDCGRRGRDGRRGRVHVRNEEVHRNAAADLQQRSVGEHRRGVRGLQHLRDRHGDVHSGRERDRLRRRQRLHAVRQLSVGRVCRRQSGHVLHVGHVQGRRGLQSVVGRLLDADQRTQRHRLQRQRRLRVAPIHARAACARGRRYLCNSPPACKLNTTCSATGTCNYSQNVPDGTADTKCGIRHAPLLLGRLRTLHLGSALLGFDAELRSHHPHLRVPAAERREQLMNPGFDSTRSRPGRRSTRRS